MIPKSDIAAWSKKAPWKNNHLVEQDLVIERALVEIYSSHELSEQLIFRGGTAIHKLYFDPQPRYSEDIDFVQKNSGPAGELLTLLRERLSFLGRARYQSGLHSTRLIFHFQTEFEPIASLRLKVEINTREHFSIYGYKSFRRDIQTEWFSGSSDIKCFELEELLATKLRALYQRRKGRDLFDLWYANSKTVLNVEKIVTAFHEYIAKEDLTITREEFIQNMEEKINDDEFKGDTAGLLRPGIVYEISDAWEIIKKHIVEKI